MPPGRSRAVFAYRPSLLCCAACSDASVLQPPAEPVCDSCLAERRLALDSTLALSADSLTPVVVKTIRSSTPTASRSRIR